MTRKPKVTPPPINPFRKGQRHKDTQSSDSDATMDEGSTTISSSDSCCLMLPWSTLIPEPQRKGKFGAKSRFGCMMVGYVHDSTTTWRVWDPEHQTVRTQSDAIFNEVRNLYASLPGDPEATTDSLCLIKEVAHVEVLEVQHSEKSAGQSQCKKSAGQPQHSEEVGRTAAVQEVGRTTAALREVGRMAAREADTVCVAGRTAAREVDWIVAGGQTRIQAEVSPDMVVGRKAASGKQPRERVATALDTTV